MSEKAKHITTVNIKNFLPNISNGSVVSISSLLLIFKDEMIKRISWITISTLNINTPYTVDWKYNNPFVATSLSYELIFELELIRCLTVSTAAPLYISRDGIKYSNINNTTLKINIKKKNNNTNKLIKYYINKI